MEFKEGDRVTYYRSTTGSGLRTIAVPATFIRMGKARATIRFRNKHDPRKEILTSVNPNDLRLGWYSVSEKATPSFTE